MRNMNDLVRQAGVMQNKIAKMQQEMAERTVEASSGGGMVKVVATCKQDIVSITLDPKAPSTKPSASDAPRWTAKSAPSPAASSCPVSFKDIGKGEEAPF